MKQEQIKLLVIEWANENLYNDFKFRPNQLETIVKIVFDKVNNKAAHHIVQAPTGSGKSYINIIAAGVLFKYFNKQSYILCSDLYLFKQYVDMIEQYNLVDFGTLKGQTGNYMCSKLNKDMRQATCTMCGMSYKKMSDILYDKENTTINKDLRAKFYCVKSCPYMLDRFNAVNSPITIMTYHLFHFQMNVCDTKVDSHGLPIEGQFQYRDYIFCDEAHNIFSIFQNTCRPCIKRDDLNKMRQIFNFYKSLKNDPEKLKIFKRIDENLLQARFSEYWGKMFDVKLSSYDNTILLLNYTRKIVNHIYTIGTRIQSMFATKIKNGFTLTTREHEIYGYVTWLQNYHCYLDDFCRAIEITGFNYTYKQIMNKSEICFGCAKEDGIISQFLLKNVNVNGGSVVCSATIGDKDAFIDNMGYKYQDNSNVEYIDIESSFNFKNSPIFIDDETKVTYNNKKESLPIITNKIIDILIYHKNENGMIQTGSYEISKYVYEALPLYLKHRVLTYSNVKEKTEAIKKIKNDTNYVIMGPSIVEGIDLPGKLCSFVIIAKIPYLSLGDMYVRAKMRIFKKWYNITTMNAILQGIGRGNRFANDKSNVYIIDGCFKRIYAYTKKYWPKYITDRFAYKRIEDVVSLKNSYDNYVAA